MLHRILDISLQYYQRFPSLLVGGQTDCHHSLYEHNARAIGIGGGTSISVSAVGSRSHGRLARPTGGRVWLLYSHFRIGPDYYMAAWMSLTHSMSIKSPCPLRGSVCNPATARTGIIMTRRLHEAGMRLQGSNDNSEIMLST